MLFLVTSAARPKRLWLLGPAGVLGVLLVWAAVASPRSAPAETPDAPKPAEVVPAAAAASHPMDEPLRVLAEARQAYQDVRDYTCLLIKRERIAGQLQPNQVMHMKVRGAPFSVYFRWQEPKDVAGQEACYVVGRNDGKMRVRSPGILGAVGFLSLDLNDPRARKSSNRSISDAGIGNLIERLKRQWEAERTWNVTQTNVGEYEYAKRRCTRVEAVHPETKDGKFATHRTVVYFDKEYKLPVRIECYDWPREGAAAGELIDVYSYVNLKLNVGLGDEVFNH